MSRLRLDNASGIRISLASPELIHAWSYGEVTKPETIHYRTLKPEQDGLFDERIFGPEKSWTCRCGKYRRVRFRGLVCEKCGVEVTHSRVRRERMGHIELACPVSHIWFAKGMPSRMALLLGLSPRNLWHVLYYEHYIVTALDEDARRRELARIDEAILHLEAPSGKRGVETLWNEGNRLPERERREKIEAIKQQRTELVELNQLDLLTEERYRTLSAEFDHVFCAGMGAEAVRVLLAGLNLLELSAELRAELDTAQEQQARKKLIKRLQVVEAFRQSCANPAWMILTALPVLPPELRPVLQIDGARFASADVNVLYVRVINRNNRLKHLIKVGAPTLILNHERRMLQEACDALFDNAHRARPVEGPTGQPLKSLSDVLSGKMGRFRRNLLGKRVDYSGRSVIVVGPDLKLHQCGLPKKMAMELFKPFLIRKVLQHDLAPTLRSAKRFVERRGPKVWDYLEEVMGGNLVLLNRAPTLHRLSIQAFEPVLIEGSAIQLHPLVCSSFNADFDGDQMAVHLPITPLAQQEARTLLLSRHNLLHPATGEPSIGASQDMVLGCFYLTQERPDKKGQGRAFSDANEARLAYDSGIIDLQARIRVRLGSGSEAVAANGGGVTVYNDPSPAKEGAQAGRKPIETTAGRLIFNEILPRRLGYHNYAMTKEHLRQLIADCYQRCGAASTAVLADEIKRLGFAYATKSGTTFALSDVPVPPGKQEVLVQADGLIAELQGQFGEGLINEDEREVQAVAIWNAATDQITRLVEGVLDPYGPIATIAKSGATKAKFQQIRQLNGMRGLMASPSGKIISIPVRGNFKEGLTVLEYFISSHGARKGVMDRSLNTAESGYLTRRLIDVAQEVVVTEADCGTQEYLLIREEDSRALGLPDSRSRLFGRVLAAALPECPHLQVGSFLGRAAAEEIVGAGVREVRVRSVLGCQARLGVCSACYGLDLSTHAPVRLGVAVGILAAQSIGEPGTQLTMRTFHSGGIAGAHGDITQGLPRVVEVFEAYVPTDRAEIAEIAGTVEITKDGAASPSTLRIHPQADTIPLPPARVGAGGRSTRASRGKASGIPAYTIAPGRKVIVSPGQQVSAGTPLTTGAINPQDLLRLCGKEGVQQYLVSEVQEVYRNTGVYIHDKHVEVIVRQMLRHIQVETAGDTGYLPGDLVDRFAFQDANAAILAQGGEPAIAHTVLLGLIKATLAKDSWLAAASFLETTRVLTDATMWGKTDALSGLKENVILGRLIPAGTGFVTRSRTAAQSAPPSTTHADRNQQEARTAPTA